VSEQAVDIGDDVVLAVKGGGVQRQTGSTPAPAPQSPV
jgi:hypothetical protein